MLYFIWIIKDVKKIYSILQNWQFYALVKALLHKFIRWLFAFLVHLQVIVYFY